MFQWIEAHATAVQALTGIISLIFAVLAIVVTWWNVRLTKALAQTSHFQLSALLQPLITFELNELFEGRGYTLGKESFSLGPVVKIKNAGSSPIKLKRVALVMQTRLPPRERREYIAKDYSNRVLLPEEEITGLYDVETEIDYGPVRDFWVAALKVECTDLSQLIVHTFMLHPQHGMFHSSTADKPPSLLSSVAQAAQFVKRFVEFENSESSRSQAGGPA